MTLFLNSSTISVLAWHHTLFVSFVKIISICLPESVALIMFLFNPFIYHSISLLSHLQSLQHLPSTSTHTHTPEKTKQKIGEKITNLAHRNLEMIWNLKYRKQNSSHAKDRGRGRGRGREWAKERERERERGWGRGRGGKQQVTDSDWRYTLSLQ